jgi:hypothetical protein
MELLVPEHFLVMGAIGAARLAREATDGHKTRFASFEVAKVDFQSRTFECEGCANRCEVVELLKDGSVVDRYGDRCGRWSEL